jgi:hypothetical protein
MNRADKQRIMDLLRKAGLWEEADQYRERVRQRLRDAGKAKQEAVAGAWEEMWDMYRPAVEQYEKRQQDAATAQLAGMPKRTTDDILDPNYTELDRGKQIRDGVLWAAMEFDRVIEETESGPVAHLEDARRPGSRGKRRRRGIFARAC